MSRIVLHMIVGARREPFLLHSLDNVAHEVELAIINENGFNIHNHRAILNSRFAREGRLIHLQVPFEHFSQARNVCIENTPESNWDWLLRLDCDEVYFPNEFSELVANLDDWAAGGVGIVRVPFYHLLSWRTLQSQEDCAHFFRWHPSLRWGNAVHEVLNAHGVTIRAGEEFFHYSYTRPQIEVYHKWQLYSDLEGDPEHYRSKGSIPEEIIADRYANAGAPFFEEHPPGAKEYWKGQVSVGQARDVPLKMLAAIHGETADQASFTLAELQKTTLHDYPIAFILFGLPEIAQQLRERHGHEAEIQETLAADFRVFRYWAVDYFQDRLKQETDWGSVMLIAGGLKFETTIWQKSLINAIYCLPEYQLYRPENSHDVVLIPRDVLAWQIELYCKEYASPFVKVSE